MADATPGKLRVIIVTPEKAVLDEPAEIVILPLFDGEVGVQRGHAPFVGQLGPGELRIGTGAAAKRYFIDGGFAQVRANVVNVLTPKASVAGDLTPAALSAAAAAAERLPESNAAEKATKRRAEQRTEAMTRVAAK